MVELESTEGAVVVYEPWPEEGCTLAEARERTADSELRREWRARISGYKNLDEGPTILDGGLREIEDDRRVRKRLRNVIEDLEAKINANFRLLMRQKRLIAIGRPGKLDAPPQVITADLWPALTGANWTTSVVGENRRGGSYFLAVHVYPVILAPCRVDLLAGLPLQEVFASFVLQDPEVVVLTKQAIALKPEFARVFVEGRCYPRGVDEWPLAFAGHHLGGVIHADPQRRSIFACWDDPHPRPVSDAMDALTQRYVGLLNLLRNGELQGVGIPAAPNHPTEIPISVWAHRRFHFNAQVGDILESNPECDDPPRDWLVNRWTGVVLRRPQAVQPRQDVAPAAFHVEPTKHAHLPPCTAEQPPTVAAAQETATQASIGEAIKQLWPEGIPRGLRVKERDRQIRTWQEGHGLAVASEKSIARYLLSQKATS